MEFGDGRHSSQFQLSNYFPAQNRHHEEKLKQAVMELFSETYRFKSSSSARFEAVQKEKAKMTIENRLSSLFPAIFDNPPNHPPYAVMVMAAIGGLNEKRGSKEESISKYIKEKYKNLPWAHPKMLEDHLEKLVETGEILYVQKSRYRLPKNLDPEPNASPKREQQPKHKRGRELDQQVVRSLCEDDDGLIAIPKSKRTRVVEVECLQKQMPGRCLLPEQAEQHKTVEKSCFNEYGLIVHKKDSLKLTIKLGLKQNSRSKGRPPKRRDAEQVEHQKPVGESESSEDRFNQQPADGMQVETETKEDCSDQNAVLGIIVENEKNHNGLAGIKQLKEQPPVEENDMNVDLSNHHSMGTEVENQIHEGGSNHHVTVGTEVECETNDDGSEQHLMIEQEQQSPVEKIDINEDGSVVIERVVQQELVVEGSDTDSKEDGSNQHSTGGIEVGAEAREDVSKLHVTVGTEVEWETINNHLKQHLTNGVQVIRSLVPDALKQEPLLVENLPDPLAGEQTWPTEAEMAEADEVNKQNKRNKKVLPRGTSDYQAAWIVDDTDGEDSETGDDESDGMVLDEGETDFSGQQGVSRLDLVEDDEASLDLRDSDGETKADTMMAVEEQSPAEKPDANEDGAIVVEHLDQPQLVVEVSEFSEDGSNQHITGGIEVGAETKEDVLKLHVTVGTEVGGETNEYSLEQHMENGNKQVEQQPPAEKPNVNEDGSVAIVHVEQPRLVVEGSDINKVGSNQHPTGGFEVGPEANKDGNLHVTVDTAVESETNADGLRYHLIDGIEQVEQPPPVEKHVTNEDGSAGFELVEEQQPVEGSGVSQDGLNQQLTLGIEGTEAKDEGSKQYGLVAIEVETETVDDCSKQHSVGEIEQVRQNPLVEKSDISEDGLITPTDTHLIVKTAMCSMPHRRTPAEKQDTEEVELEKPVDENKSNEDGMNQHQTSGIEMTPLQHVKSGGRSPEKNKLRMQPEVVNDAIELMDDIDGLMVSHLPKVVVEDEVEPAAVTKEEDPKPVRQTRWRACKKCAPEQKQAMSDAVEPGDGNGAKVEVAATEEVEPAAVRKDEEPKPVRQTSGRVCQTCTSEQQQGMSDAVEAEDGNGAKVEVAVTEEVEPEAVPKEVEPNPVRQTRRSARKRCPEAVSKEVEPNPVRQTRGSARKRCPEAVPKEVEPNPVRQTRGSARKRCTLEQQQVMSDAVKPGDGNGYKVEVAVKEEVEPMSVTKEEEPNPVRQTRGKARRKYTPEQQQAMSDATEPTADNDATIEVAVKEDEGKMHLQSREQGAQGRRPPKKHVCKPDQEDEIIVVVEEEEQKVHGRGGRLRGIGREETIVAAAEKIHKPCGQRGRQRGRGQEETLVEAVEEEKKSCGQGGKQRGRGPEETVVVVEEEEQKPCGQRRG